MTYKKCLLTLLFCHYLGITAFAQSNKIETGNWFGYFANVPLYKKLGFMGDIQYRNRTMIADPENVTFRAGLDYKFNNNMKTAAGYAYILNFKNDTNVLRSYENRIWEQFVFSKYFGRFYFDNRLRLEQRWITGQETNYVNRIRYKLQVFIPINKPTFEPGTFFLSVYDEVFIRQTDSPFDQNRLYGAMGIQISKILSVQLGYLNQTTQNNSRNYLQVLVTNKF